MDDKKDDDKKEVKEVLLDEVAAMRLRPKKLTGNTYEVGTPVGNAFITKLGLGTSAVNANYSLEVNGSTRVVNNIDVGGIINQW